jgi:tRNA 2-thiocytidine biosynthesis protein TtcA
MALIELLLSLQSRAPFPFEVGALVVDQGFAGFDAIAVASFAAARGVATWIVRADIRGAIEELSWRHAPCALCARLRRGVLYRVASELGFPVLALGHHADDAIETLLMNMFHNGQMRGMGPLWIPEDPAAPRVIRPLLTCLEADLDAYARARDFRPVDPACPLPVSPETQRMALKRLIRELSAEHPRLRQSLLASMANVAPEALMDLGLLGRPPIDRSPGASVDDLGGALEGSPCFSAEPGPRAGGSVETDAEAREERAPLEGDETR